MTPLSPLAVELMVEIKRRVKHGENLSTSALVFFLCPYRGYKERDTWQCKPALTELVKANLIRFGASGYYLTELGKGWEG
jgi:hypothetical protein